MTGCRDAQLIRGELCFAFLVSEILLAVRAFPVFNGTSFCAGGILFVVMDNCMTERRNDQRIRGDHGFCVLVSKELSAVRAFQVFDRAGCSAGRSFLVMVDERVTGRRDDELTCLQFCLFIFVSVIFAAVCAFPIFN
jgi:hypothetical protein